MTEPRRPWKARAMGVLGAALGIALIAVIFWRIPFDMAEFKQLLHELPLAGLVAVALLTAFHCFLTGLKWQLVTRHTAAGVDLGLGYYLYSTLIALFGHIMPLQVAVLAGRSLSLRLHGKVPVHRGAVGAVYDQLFDVLIPLLALVSATPFFAGWLSLWGTATGTVALIVLAGMTIAWRGEVVLSWLARQAVRWVPRLEDRVQAVEQGLFSRRTLATLYGYSILRYANLVLRAGLIAWALGLDVSWPAIMYCNSVVTFSLLISFVPGALGVMEWGWIGSLQLFGLSEVDGAHYALVSRILIVASLLILNGLHAVLYVALRGRQRKS